MRMQIVRINETYNKTGLEAYTMRFNIASLMRINL